MAVKPYIGIDNKARQVKKCYVGISDKARTVKKAYMGIDGKARCIFNGSKDTLSYYGTATATYNGCMRAVTATIGNHALVSAGDVSTGAITALTVYDDMLTRSIINKNDAIHMRSGASNSAAAVFAGGWSKSYSYYPTSVDAYSNSLVATSLSELSVGRTYPTGATVGDCILFAGGYKNSTYYTNVDAYDSSLTKISVEALPVGLYNMAGVSGKDYAIFAGGKKGNATLDSGYSNAVYAYNKSLTCSELASLSIAKHLLAGAKTGDITIFAGGSNTNVTNAVDAYDASLVAIPAIGALRTSVTGIIGATLGKYALFAGGTTTLSNYKDASSVGSVANVDSYDTSLVRTVQHDLSVSRCLMGSAVIGDYALLISGSTKSAYSNAVDVFQLT